MRFRNFADSTTSRSYHRHWQSWPATVYEEFDNILTRVKRSSTMVDVVTPNYLSIRNKGGIVCSPKYKEELYSCVDYTTFALDGFKDGSTRVVCEDHNKALLESSLVQKLSSADVTAFEQTMALFSRETDLAIQRAHADVDVSEMMLLASIGELPETLQYLASCIQRVVKLARSLRKKREVANILRSLRYNAAETAGRTQRSFVHQLERYTEVLTKRKLRNKLTEADANALATLSNLWLEWRYAIRPMIGDIQNALKALSTKLRNARLTARGHEYRIGDSEKRESKVVTFGSMIWTFNAKIKEAESVKSRAGCLYDLDASIASFEEIFGLDQIVESAYELIPFSFIFDWVFSMGDMLQGMFKSSGLNVLTTWVSLNFERTREVHITSANCVGRNGYTWPVQTVELGSCYETVKYGWRKPNPEFPILPRMDLKLDLSKIFDLGAIGRSILSGKTPPQVTRRD